MSDPSRFKIPGGKQKGTPLPAADLESISWWRNKIGEGLAADPAKQYADRDRQWIEAADAEIARRRGGGAQAPATKAPSAAPAVSSTPQSSTALARPQAPVALARTSGTFSRGADVTQRLADAAAGHAHIVAPATACDVIPEGCAIALSVVSIDAEAETYSLGYNPARKAEMFGLSKVAIDKIVASAGVSWDSTQCRRLDDGRDPRYCLYYAVGTYRHFDGTETVVTGTKEMDLRDGSPQVEALEERARSKGKTADAQIREMRLHILAHAESKAKLRAGRSLGIRTSYTREELARPFVVAKLMFTGQSDDPEIRRMFAAKRADAMLGGHRALFGVAPVAPQPVMALQAPVSAPPMLPHVRGEVDEDDYYEPVEAVPPARPTPPQQAPAHATTAPTESKAAKPHQGEMSAEDVERARRIDAGEEDRGDNPENY